VANDSGKGSSEPVWLVWAALLLAGLLLLADAFHIYQLTKWTARLGIALVFSALALFIGNGRWPSTAATAIVWLAVVLCYIL